MCAKCTPLVRRIPRFMTGSGISELVYETIELESCLAAKPKRLCDLTLLTAECADSELCCVSKRLDAL